MENYMAVPQKTKSRVTIDPAIPILDTDPDKVQEHTWGVSLVVQWLRICLSTGNTGSIPGQETKIPHAREQLEPSGSNSWAQECRAHGPQLESPHTAMKDPARWNKDSGQPNNQRHMFLKDTCMPMFTAALLTIAKTCKHPKCPSTDECTKTWGIYAMEYCLATKKNEIMPFKAPWKDLEMTIPREVSQRKTNIAWYHLYVESLKTIHMNLHTKEKETHSGRK